MRTENAGTSYIRNLGEDSGHAREWTVTGSGRGSGQQWGGEGQHEWSRLVCTDSPSEPPTSSLLGGI